MIQALRVLFLVLLSFAVLLFAVYTFKPDSLEYIHDFLDSTHKNASSFRLSGNFDCGSKWTQQYKEFHAKSLKSNKRSNKYLIYYCHGHTGGCGGFGNRMMGLISTFYLAVLTNRTFLVHWGGPERLETYLEPNEIDWRFDERQIKNFKSRSTYWGLNAVQEYDRYFTGKDRQFMQWLNKARLETYFDFPVEKLGAIWYFANNLFDNTALKKRAKNYGIPVPHRDYPYGMMGCAMRFLFRKSKRLIKEFNLANEALKSRARPFIGIHIRTSDHHFGSNNEFSYRTRDPKRVFACARRVEQALKKKHLAPAGQPLTWFLAADDIKLKMQALKNYPKHVITLDIEPKHLDHSGSAAEDVFRDLLVDMLLLMECDFFIPTRGSTYSYIVLGTRQLSTRNFVLGEQCNLNEKNIELLPPP